jgi:YHS domain-containing protein
MSNEFEMPRRLFLLGAGSVLASAVAGQALAQRAPVNDIYTGIIPNTAVGGYDAVSYFQSGPIRGRTDITHEWKGATWRFATEENRAAFRNDPVAFAPKYGGHCSFAAARGTRTKGDPLVWKIVNNRLYLNLNQAVHRQWERDEANEIRRADANWPRIAA